MLHLFVGKVPEIEEDRSVTNSYTGTNFVYYTEANGRWVMTCKVRKSNASELV